MALESFANILSLLCTIVGLLYCVFKYIEVPRRGFRLLIGFFLAKFLSEYYWTIYELVMHANPDVSGFTAYLGWNASYLCLFLAVLCMRREGARRFFHPVMLAPILTNVPRFFLYIRYGGLLNNLWEVRITTLTMATELENYLTVASTTLRVTADSVDLIKDRRSIYAGAGTVHPGPDEAAGGEV